MVKLVEGTETDKWLPKLWRKSTFPILHQPAKTSDDIAGSAFLLHYKRIPYIVSAKHIIKTKNPVIAFATKNRRVICVPSTFFLQAGLSWIEHPAGLDLVAIPFHLPLSKVRDLDLKLIDEKAWANQSKIKVNDIVVHLGYPEKVHMNYSNGSPSAFPIGMPGKIVSLEKPYFIMETAGARGASGGPVFLRRGNNYPLLMGVVIEAKMFGKPTRPEGSKYLNETKALVVSLMKDIFESEDMKKQYENRKLGIHWL